MLSPCRRTCSATRWRWTCRCCHPADHAPGSGTQRVRAEATGAPAAGRRENAQHIVFACPKYCFKNITDSLKITEVILRGKCRLWSWSGWSIGPLLYCLLNLRWDAIFAKPTKSFRHSSACGSSRTFLAGSYLIRYRLPMVYTIRPTPARVVGVVEKAIWASKSFWLGSEGSSSTSPAWFYTRTGWCLPWQKPTNWITEDSIQPKTNSIEMAISIIRDLDDRSGVKWTAHSCSYCSSSNLERQQTQQSQQ